MSKAEFRNRIKKLLNQVVESNQKNTYGKFPVASWVQPDWKFVGGDIFPMGQKLRTNDPSYDEYPAMMKKEYEMAKKKAMKAREYGVLGPLDPYTFDANSDYKYDMKKKGKKGGKIGLDMPIQHSILKDQLKLLNKEYNDGKITKSEFQRYKKALEEEARLSVMRENIAKDLFKSYEREELEKARRMKASDAYLKGRTDIAKKLKGMSTIRGVPKRGGKKGESDWVKYVKKVMKDEGVSYKDALQIASKNKKKGGYIQAGAIPAGRMNKKKGGIQAGKMKKKKGGYVMAGKMKKKGGIRAGAKKMSSGQKDWIAFVKKVAKEFNLPYNQALVKASEMRG